MKKKSAKIPVLSVDDERLGRKRRRAMEKT